MKKALLFFLCIFSPSLLVPTVAQEDFVVMDAQDTIPTEKAHIQFADTLTAKEYKALDKQAKLKIVEDFTPNPTKAVIYSAIFPGLGQIYNRKYWKLPIVYGGFLGVVYAVTWNGNMYTDYQNGYRDIMLDPNKYTRWHQFVADPNKVQDMERLKSQLKSRRDYFRRNRDLAIIVGVGLYALCMVDAYVDAQLYNFTISPDLSMTVAPVVWGPSQSSNSFTVGVQCNITF